MDEAAITFSAEWIEQFTVEDDNAGGGVYRCNTKNGCILGPICSLFGDTSMDEAAIMFSAEWIEQFTVEEGALQYDNAGGGVYRCNTKKGK